MANTIMFDVDTVKSSMNVLENTFNDFSNSLKEINSYIETKVNVDESSAVFGIYGSKLLEIWNQNASTFGDFHANFTAWSEVVSVISDAKQSFAIDTAALYRNNGGNLDGVEVARESLKTGVKAKDIQDEDALEVLNSASKAETQIVINEMNKYGGRTISYTDALGRQRDDYYDDQGNLVGYIIVGKSGNVTCYDADDQRMSRLPTNKEHIDILKKKESDEKDNIMSIIKPIIAANNIFSKENLMKKPDFSDRAAWITENVYYSSNCGQCTWFAAGKFHEIYGFKGNFTGNGCDTAKMLASRDSRFELSDTPKPGALFSLLAGSGSQYGHTGMVLDVQGDKMTIFDGNYNGTTDSFSVATKDWGIREVSLNYWQKGAGRYGGVVFANPREGAFT